MRLSTEVELPELNMTPMIDVIFQLLIFFMLVTSMESSDVEALVVPKAIKAVEDKEKSDKRIMVSVAHKEIECDSYTTLKTDPRFKKVCRQAGHWEIKFRKQAYTEEQLGARLRILADEVRDTNDREISNVPLMIRADQRAPWEQVQRILVVCVSPVYKVMIWKIEIAVELEKVE
ncbi:MAG: biopolymer transporter ExbD [Planctomycetota bacterium]|nr:biopolymer transporter ExbD [Planctomycetota bacterium]